MKRQGEVRKLIISHFHLGADVIRGPLTVEQVEKELDERAKEEWPDGRATFKGPEWNQLKSKVKQGGEFYFYESDRPSWTDIFPSVEGACLQHCHDLAVSGPLPQFA